ncbi:HNH endonuclease [Streptomyces sp. NPDC057909]|uniref:HNH endonuclease n=1 Tax=Streptomyces sp. NPDC057909 TaxID=3346277 RepID=UPI0036ECFCDA
MSSNRLAASRRRLRKEQLAQRHGARCTYCLRPFTSLGEATLDHVVPHSLFPTWSVVHLMLACEPCNHAKADRLPLSMALLLIWTQGSDQRDDQRHARRHTQRTVDRPLFTDPDRPTRSGPTRLAPDDVNWLLLARIVHARSSTEQSPPDQAEHRMRARRAVRVGRLEHRRRMPRLNACEQPADRGVSA